MAICVIKRTTQLGPQFVLTPERYNPKRRMSLSDENDGILLSEIIALENDIAASKKDSSAWYQINTSDAMGGYLTNSPESRTAQQQQKNTKVWRCYHFPPSSVPAAGCIC